MVDGMVNRPFMEPSGPIRREGNRATRDLARGYGVRMKRWKESRREGNSGDFLRRVSDRRRRIATFAPGHWKTGRRESQNIVVSARGWLVVNPVGVAMPTVGWKRAPLSAVASIAIITSDKYFAYVAYRNCILTHMFIEL
jgi:hypothetical protein